MANAHPKGETVASPCVEIGARPCDGSIYAGKIGSDHLYVPRARAEVRAWDDAIGWCAKLGDNWRVPTRDELAFLHPTVVESGIGNLRGTTWYWSSSLTDFGEQSLAWAQNFVDGQGGYASLGNRFATTCVRVDRDPL